MSPEPQKTASPAAPGEAIDVLIACLANHLDCCADVARAVAFSLAREKQSSWPGASQIAEMTSDLSLKAATIQALSRQYRKDFPQRPPAGA